MRRTLAGLLLSLFWASAPARAEPPATVAMVLGEVTASAPAGSVRALVKGDAIAVGEVVATGPNSFVNLHFSDGGFVLLRPGSLFVIEAYRFTPVPPAAEAVAAAPVENRNFMRLLRGGFRALTGAIGKGDPETYRVTTPLATIGIRGTDYVAVLCDAACALDPVIAASLPAGASTEGALVAGVIEGGIVLGGAAVPTDVAQDRYVLGLPGGAVRALSGEPRFLRIDPIPNPRTCR